MGSYIYAGTETNDTSGATSAMEGSRVGVNGHCRATNARGARLALLTIGSREL